MFSRLSQHRAFCLIRPLFVAKFVTEGDNSDNICEKCKIISFLNDLTQQKIV